MTPIFHCKRYDAANFLYPFSWCRIQPDGESRDILRQRDCWVKIAGGCSAKKISLPSKYVSESQSPRHISARNVTQIHGRY